MKTYFADASYKFTLFWLFGKWPRCKKPAHAYEPANYVVILMEVRI